MKVSTGSLGFRVKLKGRLILYYRAARARKACDVEGNCLMQTAHSSRAGKRLTYYRSSNKLSPQ
ncbi:MAG: hypothetical protein WCB68_10590 [Pyrinomonadaceae bacterium]